MNYNSSRGYQGRRSGTGGGGCGCGCNGAVKGTKPCQSHYSAMYPPTNQQPYQAVYTTANQPMYQPTNPFPNQPINQYPLINQPMYQLGNQSAYQPDQQPVIPPEPSPELLRLLEEAVLGESEDQAFYKQLIALAPTSTEKDIITGIRDDKMSHYKQFRLIYHDLTGQEISKSTEFASDEQTLAYKANLRKALFGEIEAVKKYRVIRSELTTKIHRDMLFDIITDELTHMGKYNYLITSESYKKMS